MTAAGRALAVGPLGVLAGGGQLPIELARAVIAGGRALHVVAIRGQADPAVSAFPHTWVGIGEVGGLLRALKRAGCRELVILGSVRRPDWGALRLDLGALLRLPRILKLTVGGDDAVLVRVAGFFATEGIEVVGAMDVVPALLVPAGPLGRYAPDATHERDIALGLAIVRRLGPYDVGQGVIVTEGRIEAIEAAEGTDGMLDRIVQPRADAWNGRHKPWDGGATFSRSPRRGVLVKRPKPGQDLRLDLPAIGPRTIQKVDAARLAGIAVLAGGALVAERAKTIAAADAAGLFVFGETDAGHDAPIDAEPPPPSGLVRGWRLASPRRMWRWQLEATLPGVDKRLAADADIGLAVARCLASYKTGRIVAVQRGRVLAITCDEEPGAAIHRAFSHRSWRSRFRPRRLEDPRRALQGVVVSYERPLGAELISEAWVSGFAGIGLVNVGGVLGRDAALAARLGMVVLTAFTGGPLVLARDQPASTHPSERPKEP